MTPEASSEREPLLPGIILPPPGQAFGLTEHDHLPAVGRKELDAYYTPPALADAAVGWLVQDGYVWDGMSALEPSAGRGAWVDALHQHALARCCQALDIDRERVGELQARGIEAYEGDFLTQDFAKSSCAAVGRYDLVIGNPPFGAAEAHVRRALGLRSRFGVVAFLLRLAFLESAERIEFWKEHPASKIYVLSERPSFSGGKTDNSAYGIFTWATWHRGPTHIEVVQWKNQ